MFLSRFLSALGVGAILLTQLGMIGVTMLLQLGGLPDYARSKLSKFFWHLWALVVRPCVCVRVRVYVYVCVCVCQGTMARAVNLTHPHTHTRARAHTHTRTYPDLACSPLVFGTFIDRYASPPFHQVLQQWTATFMAAIANILAYASFEAQFGVNASPRVQLQK